MVYFNYKKGETIFAPASAPQKSGIIVVRVSGPEVSNIYQHLGFKPLKSRQATVSKLYHPQTKQLIDQAILTQFNNPHSFTGEDVLEISIHGSKIVLKILLSALASIKNLRLAEPGEFSMRAFFNNKMDLTQIEGLADLIEAETEVQHHKALQQMSGQLSELYEGWRKILLRIRGLVEAYIDFPDEDIPESVTAEATENINTLKQEILQHLSLSKRGEKIREGIYVAIIGPTNAGKSSLLNRIAQRDIAIVSNIAGTTRDVIETFLNIKGYPIILADTAGIRQSQETLEQEGIKRSLKKAEEADIKIIVFDGTTDYAQEKEILSMIDSDTILVFNKTDIMSKNDQKELPTNAIKISTKDDTNINLLIQELALRAEQICYNHTAPIITRERYRQNLTECCKCLAEFSLDKDIVLAAEDLRAASEYLGRIIGKIDVESILGEIFSNFCIGK